MHEYPLTTANRLRLARVYERSPRVDLAIDCAIEGRMGRALADHPANPKVFLIQQGPCVYLAGDAGAASAPISVQSIPRGFLVMPSPARWLEVLRKLRGSELVEQHRYSFSSGKLESAMLESLVRESRHTPKIRRMDAEMARTVANTPDSPLDLTPFGSPDAFVERGVGFCLLENQEVAGVAYSSLVCSRGHEISVYVSKGHRQCGLGTALCAILLSWCLERGIDPHWDAANLESCGLARKLGYQPIGRYEAYFLAGGSTAQGGLGTWSTISAD